MIAIVIYIVDKIQGLNKSQKDKMKNMPVSKQILIGLLCFSPYIIYFIIIMIVAITLS
jgi:hypothetical protein